MKTCLEITSFLVSDAALTSFPAKTELFTRIFRMKSHLLWMCVLFFALISVDSIPNKLRERIQRERDYKVLKKNAGLVRTELPLPPKFCSIKIQGLNDGFSAFISFLGDFFSSREGTDLKFHSIVECGGKTLFEQDATIKTLKPVHLDYVRFQQNTHQKCAFREFLYSKTRLMVLLLST